MKIQIISKKDIITHPMAISLIISWANNGEVNFYTVHSDIKYDNCKVHTISSKEYIKHKIITRYLITIYFYIKMMFKLLSLRKTIVYFPFNNGPIIDRIIKYFKGDNLTIYHSFEYDEPNLRAANFADIVIHPETTRMKLASFQLPHKKHFYFPNVVNLNFNQIPYPNASELNILANGRIKLLYQGLINVNDRCLKEILEAVKEIENSYCLIIMPAPFTNSSELNKLNLLIEKYNLKNAVFFVPTIISPHHLSIVEHIDIGIGLYKPTDINKYFAAPNRIFEINQFKKPLILPDNVSLKLLEYEYKGEIFCCDPSSKESIISAINRATLLKSETNILFKQTGNFAKYFIELNSLILQTSEAELNN
jgi:hypothetical protein